MPENTVKVDRSTPFGNPYPMQRHAGVLTEWEARIGCITQFEKWLDNSLPGQQLKERVWSELPGKNLACWCPPGPCHADVLLRIANGGEAMTAEGGT